MKDFNKKIEIVRKYAVPCGVPMSAIPEMCEELNISEVEFREYIFGQTCGVVGGESIVYITDIMRFISGERGLVD